MSRQLFLDAVRGKNGTGQAVFGTPTSIACQELMDQVGAHFPAGHLDPEQMAAIAIAGHTVLGLDMVMPLFSVCHEAAAMGCNVDWGSDNAMPENGPPIFTDADDIRIPDDLLTHPGCAVPIKAIGLLKKRLGDDAAVCGKVFGSWTQSYHYFGIERFLVGTLDDPDHTRRILKRLMPVTLSFARAQIDAGADCILVADHATRDLCGPNAYEQFLLPLHRQLAAEIDVPLLLHICGDTSDRINMIARTGVDAFHWDTKTGSAAYARKLAGPKLNLIGGISNFKLLSSTPDEIAADAADAHINGINVVGPECAIPLMTPLANLKAIAGIGRNP